MTIEKVKRLLVFAAHPDDETIACGGLLQRVPVALVVFAVDGAPAGYGIEGKFGSLKKYSDERFKEAGRALGLARNCSFQRLRMRSEAYFPDRRLFQYLAEAADSLVGIAREFLPDAIVSHAFEGGHIDHDACSLLARRVADEVSLSQYEFPLYWKNENGLDIFQEFRDLQEDEMELNLSEVEIATKAGMFAEYKTQREVMEMFPINKERFRSVRVSDSAQASWDLSYPGNWRSRLDARAVRQRFAEFRNMRVK